MIIFSFLIEGIISNLISLKTQFFVPCFTLLSIPYIYKKYPDKKYYIISFIVGLLYDIVYSMPTLLHAILFLVLALCTKKVFSYISYSLPKLFVLMFIYLCLYRLLLYLLIYLSKPVAFIYLIKSISSSIILNVAYFTIIIIFHKLKKTT